MVKLGSNGEEDGVQQSNVPSTSDAYLKLQAILSQQLQAQRQTQETKAAVLDQKNEVKTYFLQQLHNIHSAVKRIAIKPVVRASARQRIGDTTATCIDDDINNDFSTLFGGQERPAPIKLYKNPRTLFDLRQEYGFGISGTKPTKKITRAERGKDKSYIVVFWQLIEQKMIYAGHTSDSAIDKIYTIYGSSLSVTSI